MNDRKDYSNSSLLRRIMWVVSNCTLPKIKVLLLLTEILSKIDITMKRSERLELLK